MVARERSQSVRRQEFALVEHPSQDALEAGLLDQRAARVFLPQEGIRKLSLRIVIAPASREAVEGRRDTPVFLGVPAVIAFRAAEPQNPLLQDRVSSVPERERETQALLTVAEARQAVPAQR